MILEYAQKVYKKTNFVEDQKSVLLINGVVNLETFEYQSNDNSLPPVKIIRTKDNVRKRPDGHNRQDPFRDDEFDDNSTKLVNPTDLEWMSLNYRKVRAAKMSPSKRRMIIFMFEIDYQYFPSLREVRDELISA